MAVLALKALPGTPGMNDPIARESHVSVVRRLGFRVLGFKFRVKVLGFRV